VAGADRATLLQSESLLVRVDPRHGCEIVEFVDLPSGRQLLGRPGYSPTEPVAGELDEDTWMRSWRGGWHMLGPNAGNACEVGSETHGFQGRASNDPWSCVEASPQKAAFVWHGHGLSIRREFALAGDELAVRVAATAQDERVPLLCVESISFGIELLDPAVDVLLPGGKAYELSEESGPASPPADAAEWPEVRLLDGSLERSDRYDASVTHNRFLTVTDMPSSWFAVYNAAREIGMHVRWDGGWLKHLWIWHEERASSGVWRHMTEMLVFEPACVPHSLGLRRAIEHEQARWLRRGETVGYGMRARVLRSPKEIPAG
jgi:hypothetical protein